MKKLILIFIITLFGITDTYGYQCDQSFYGKLRYGYNYKFYDSFSNTSGNSIGINKVDVNYTEQYDYNGTSSFPSFNWTSWFINKGYILNNGESGKVIEAGSSYPINYIPAVRSNNNFVIQYKAKYYEKRGGVWDMDHPKYHTECKYYQITWCGDGVLDSGDGEQCDPNDPSRQGWGTGGCDLSCRPIDTPQEPTCDNLGVNPTNGNVPLNSAFYCVGTNASSYKIDITKAGNLITTINGNSGNYTFTNTGSYIATCYVNGSVTSSSCTKNINVTDSNPTPVCGNGIVEAGEQCDDGNIVDGDGCSSTCTTEGSPVCGNGIVEAGEQCDDGNTTNGDGCSSTCQNEGGGGGGGGTPMCYDISVSGNTVTCYGNNKTKTFKIDCGNGINKYVGAVSNGTSQRIGTTTCDYSVNPKTTEPKCYVSGLPLNWIPNPKDSYSGWTTRNQCQNTNGQTCGNGILEGNEECEKDSSGVFPNICNTNCTLKNPVTTIPGTTPGVITIPNHGNLIFGEQANVIIYRGQSLASKLNAPYVYNDSDYDLSLKGLCVVQTSGDTLTTPAIQPNCEALPSILYPGQKITFPGAYNDYKGKRVTTGDYGDNLLKITYQNHAGEIFDWAYFATPVKVRVAKPSIVTVGGGTSYVKSVDKVSDINKVALTNKDNNKNFVGTSVSKLTSYSKNTTDSQVVENTKNQGTKYSNSLTGVVNDSSSTTSDVVGITDGQAYNGMKNVFLFKNKNLKIDTNNALDSFNGPVTFIVENGNLYINKNIIYNDNIAFVVKGGDIIIDSGVTRIDGTYITIKKGTNGGKISSAQSTDRLVVNGSLYGNIDDLVDNRVKITENAGNLSVGTVVSFGSALFRKPAPLVSQFITEYLNQSKIAQ